MTYVIAAPDMLAAAAADVAGVGSSLSEANAAAAASTTRVIPAAADEVSAAIAALFSSHGTAFQALSAQAAAFHSEFVQALSAGAGAYASTEAAVAGPLQTLAQAMPAPNVAVSYLGRTLVQLGSAHTSGGGGLEVAVGANSDATAPSAFNVALALGPGSDATVLGSYNIVQTSQFNSAIAIGTNDVAVAGGSTTGAGLIEPAGGVAGSHDRAFVLGNGSTADAGYGVGANGATSGGDYDIAAVLGNMQTATATGTNGWVDIMTPFGTLDADRVALYFPVSITL